MALPVKRVAVIGAGISGVSATAHLKASGLQVTLFERTGTSGGVWVFDPRTAPEPAYPSTLPSIAETAYYEATEDLVGSQKASDKIGQIEQAKILHAPPGPCYESLKNNVPTGLMKVTLNSWPPGTEPTVKHNILAEYIQDTASKTGVDEVTEFNTKVERLSKEGNTWKIRTSTLEPGQLEKNIRNWEFDAVVVASGHYHAPKVPEIPGLKEWKKIWPSRIQHSKRYRNPHGHEGKNILLIGGSTSSFDISKDLVGIAKTIYQSTRGGEFDLPISMLPTEVKRIPEVASFQLEPQSGSTLDDTAIPGTVTLVNGQVLTDIDRIVIATGYHCTFPFLSEYHQDSVPPSEADTKVLVTDGTQTHNLHKDMFYIPDPTLAFVGVPYHIATFSLFDFQAITVAAVFSGKARLPLEAVMRAEYNEKLVRKGAGRSFHSLKGQDVDYVNELLAWINADIVAAGGEPVRGHTDEWKKEYAVLVEKYKGVYTPKPRLDVIVEKQHGDPAPVVEPISAH